MTLVDPPASGNFSSAPALEEHPVVRAPLAFKLAAFSALVALVTGLAVSGMAYVYARTELRNRVDNRLERVAHDRREMLLSYFARQRQTLALAADRGSLRRVLEPDRTSETAITNAQQALDDIRAVAPDLIALSIANLSGDVIVSTDAGAIGQNLADLPEVKAAGPRVYLGQPWVRDGQACLHCSISILSNNDANLGTLLAQVDLGLLERILTTDVGLGDTGEVLVGIQNGQHVELLFPARQDPRRSIPLDELPAMKAALAGKAGSAAEVDGGVPALASFCPVPLDDSDEARRWGLVAKVDTQEAYAPISRFRLMFFSLQSLLIAAVVVASYGIARQLTQPISALTRHALAVADGNYGGRLDVSAADELGVLGAAFNHLTQKVQAAQAELEQAVMKRTRELAQSNTELALEITNRCAVEEALRGNERRTRAILEAAYESFIAIDGAGCITEWNRQAELTFGWSREEVLGKVLAELIIPPNLRQRHRDGLAHFLATGEGPVLGQRLEMHALNRDGREFPVEVSISALRSGNEYFFTAFLHDISQRKAAEQLLRESEERFRLLVTGVRDYALFRLDPEGHVASWNPGAERIKGYKAEEIVGKHFSVFYRPEELAAGKPANALETALSEGRFEEEGLRVRKNGELFWASVVITPLYNEQGLLRGFGKVTRDITERKEAQDALRRSQLELSQSNSDLEQFAYVASHDLQEPLRAVAGYCQLLKRRYSANLEPAAIEFIDSAVEGASRMQTLINDLLAYSRLTTQNRVFTPTDLNLAFKQAITNLETAISETGAKVTRDDLPTLPADRSQLTQLFQNLIGNAIKFRGERPPQVHVAARRQADGWLISVSDNGIGIEPRFAERIFVIFQRLHTRREYAGTGIGLAVCKKVVERHGGKIWVEPSPGGGSTFCFTLPDVTEESAHDQDQGPPGAPDRDFAGRG